MVLEPLVEEIISEFEAKNSVILSSKARMEIMKRTLPHCDMIERDVREGKVTVDFLKQSLASVLENALPYARSRSTSRYLRHKPSLETDRVNVIPHSAILISINSKCEYLFWC